MVTILHLESSVTTSQWLEPAAFKEIKMKSMSHNTQMNNFQVEQSPPQAKKGALSLKK